MRRSFALALLANVLVFGQRPEFDFFSDFRNVFAPEVRAQDAAIDNTGILKKYTAKLRSDGVEEPEIQRRLRLIETERQALEIDMWNRVYAGSHSDFNREPNAFLVETVKSLPPGAALDYSMGEGRNSIYLAQQGWKVWGFDSARAGVELAQKRAKLLGLTIHASAVSDSQYEFGKERFDLVVFSWAMPQVPVERVMASLKPGGVVVMECAENYAGRNGILKMFDALRIEQYEVVRAKADWYNRIETEIVRMIARKP